MSGPISVYSPNAGIAIISQPISFTKIPTTTDVNYPIGQIAVLEESDATFILSSKTSANGIVSAHWTAISGGTGIQVINGDVGSVTGNPITFTGGSSGAVFTGAGATMTESFNFLALPATTATDGQIRINGDVVLHAYNSTVNNPNIFLGAQSGNFTNTSYSLVGLGYQTFNSAVDIVESVAAGAETFHDVESGTGNAVYGSFVLRSITEAIDMTCIGDGCAAFATGTINDCTFVGAQAGQGMMGGENSNIYIGAKTLGAGGESNCMRLGSFTGTSAGGITTTFIQGVAGVAVSNAQIVTIDTTTGQLGSQADSPGDITTINGDIGSVTGDIVTFTGGTSGAVFTGVGSTMTESFNFLALPNTTLTNGQIRIGGISVLQALDIFSGNTNIYVGLGAGNFTNTNLRTVGVGTAALAGSTVNFDTVAVGYNCLNSMPSGSLNTAVGSTCFQGLPSGSTNNTAVGFACGINMVISSTDNILIGSRAGQSYTGGESSNILIGSQQFGIAAESHALRIGTSTGTGQGGLNKSFIHGINGITIPNSTSNIVTIDTSTSQMGATPFETGGAFTPTLAGSVTQGITTYGVQSGNYTRIGNTVWIQLYMVWTGTSATGNATIRGLPFPAGLSDLALIPIDLYQGNGAGIGASNLAWATSQLTTTVFLLQFINTVSGAVNPIPITNAGAVLFQGFYYI